MQTYPLTRIARSFDAQSWEPLTYQDTRALFDELARRFELVRCHPPALVGWNPPTSSLLPADLVSAVVDRVESGGIAAIRLAPDVVLHLRACLAPADAAPAIAYR